MLPIGSFLEVLTVVEVLSVTRILSLLDVDEVALRNICLCVSSVGSFSSRLVTLSSNLSSTR